LVKFVSAAVFLLSLGWISTAFAVTVSTRPSLFRFIGTFWFLRVVVI
jgi:hypothetical protein